VAADEPGSRPRRWWCHRHLLGGRVGRIARSTHVADSEARHAAIAARVPGKTWPARLRTTAVDAATGEVVVFDHTTGVSLVDAVAASCAVPRVWPTVTVDDRPLMDGGAASATYAALARNHPIVLVLAPLSPAATSAIEDEVAELAASGSRVLVIGPDPEYQNNAGADPLNPARRAEAARAGNAFATGAAASAREAWHDTNTTQTGQVTHVTDQSRP
jgi:NTE family protein